jgi:hypothetical protein
MCVFCEWISVLRNQHVRDEAVWAANKQFSALRPLVNKTQTLNWHAPLQIWCFVTTACEEGSVTIYTHRPCFTSIYFAFVRFTPVYFTYFFPFNAPCQFKLLNLRSLVFGLTPSGWLRFTALTAFLWIFFFYLFPLIFLGKQPGRKTRDGLLGLALRCYHTHTLKG